MFYFKSNVRLLIDESNKLDRFFRRESFRFVSELIIDTEKKNSRVSAGKIENIFTRNRNQRWWFVICRKTRKAFRKRVRKDGCYIVKLAPERKKGETVRNLFNKMLTPWTRVFLQTFPLISLWTFSSIYNVTQKSNRAWRIVSLSLLLLLFFQIFISKRIYDFWLRNKFELIVFRILVYR